MTGVVENWRIHTTAHEAFEDEMRLRGKDGSYGWFLVRTAPFFNEHGDVVKWYGVSIDIEASKKAQDELKLAYQRLSYHMENTPLAVIEYDQHVCIRRWSARAEEIFGWTAEEVIGKSLNSKDFPFVYEEDVDAVNKVAEQLTKGLVDRNLNRNRNLTKHGEVLYCEWYNSVLRDQDGKVITILSLMQNVTEREKAAEVLKESYEEIRRLTDHLQRVREEERTHIAREIHDELGGQLTVLKMDASWLNQKLAPEEKAIRQRIKNLVLMLDRTLKSVRRISSQLRPTLLDSLGLIAAMEWHLKEFEKNWDIMVTFEKPEEDPIVPDVTKDGLFRIFQESLTNVARHSQAKHVNVSLMVKSDSLVLRIADDGVGFDQQQIASKKTLGILGMRERTAMLGGKYEIASILGEGTTVTVALPLRANIPKAI
ncbi:MAG TPA: PAS domain S-box protein [Cyclobacteriaceae bacterium]|nr:PAS domain S-box protein [Cyclobacteriaceae bacterium]